MFAKYLETDQIVFKHALGCRDVYGKEFHIFNELFLLLSDDAKFTSDRLIQDLFANSLVIIPKHQYHQFDNVGDEKNYHRYVLQFDLVSGLEETINEVFDRVKVIRNINPQTVLLFKKLDSLAEDAKSQKDKETLLTAIVTEILMDLKYNYTDTTTIDLISDKTIVEIIDYINENFLSNITVATIARQLNFSESYISHKFKKIMHISIYKYILQKKLIHAHKLINEGVSATDAAFTCGFKEYSGFYKIYKDYFGFSPSKTNIKKA